MSTAVFDDLPPAWVLDPFLTSVSQSAYEIGKRAAELMLERLAGDTPAEPRTIALPSELIKRRSTAPPRQGAATSIPRPAGQTEKRT